jgi:hypothetical protein
MVWLLGTSSLWVAFWTQDLVQVMRTSSEAMRFDIDEFCHSVSGAAAMTSRTKAVAVLTIATSLLGGAACDKPRLQPSSPPTLTAPASDRPPSWVERGISL